MNIKIICERCGVEKEIEAKVPKFCGNECRVANLKELKKKTVPSVPDVEVTPDIPEVITVEEIPADLVPLEVPNVDELQGERQEEIQGQNNEENQVVT